METCANVVPSVELAMIGLLFVLVGVVIGVILGD